MFWRTQSLIGLGLFVACESKVVEQSSKLGQSSRDLADRTANQLSAIARAPGDLSERSRLWLSNQAHASGVEQVILRGQQLAPAAVAIHETLRDAIDRSTSVEPIYQTIEPSDIETTDAAISDMPRVEIIDGLKVGFKQMDHVDSGTLVKERGYLLTWRSGDRLLGLVYRSKRSIDLSKLVDEAPRLVRLVQKAASGPD